MRLIYFSPVSAQSYAQRPHFMVQQWLRWGAQAVVWVDPYPCRLPRWQDLKRPAGLGDQRTRLDRRVEVLRVPALPVEPLPAGAWLNQELLGRKAWSSLVRFGAQRPVILGIGRPGALALRALQRLRPDASFFDAMDNFPEFHTGLSRRAMKVHEDRIAAAVDLIVASSTFLAEKFARRGLRVVKLLNGYPMSALPAWQPRPKGKPVLGFIGAIGKWFDWPLVLRLAGRLPEMDLELVGPCSAGPPGRLPANVRMLPACPQHEAPGLLARWSAGLIPFRPTALTAGMDPIKYYEYRAMGLPVLSTTFGEMALRGPGQGVYFLDRGEDPAAAVLQALNHPCPSDQIARFRRAHDWQRRFAQVDLPGMLLFGRARGRAA